MSFSRSCSTLIGIALLALGFGCGGESDAASHGATHAPAENSAAGVADKQVEVMSDMAAILQDVTDVASLEAAKPKMAALGKRLDGYMQQWKANMPSIMAQPGGAQQLAAHAQKLADVQQKLSAQVMRLASDPALREQTSALFDSMGDAMQQDAR